MLQLGALYADVDGLGLSGFYLGFRLQHVAARGDAAAIAVVGELQRFLKGDHGVVEQLFLPVQRAQLKIILRQFGAGAQGRCFKVRRAGLSGRFARLDGATDAAPNIQLPGDVDG